MDRTTIKSLAETTAELVAGVPELYRVAAFGAVLGQLLASNGHKPEGASPVHEPQANAAVELDHHARFLDMLRAPLDYSAYVDAVESGSWVDRALTVLLAAENEFGIVGLTPAEVADVLKSRLRLKSVYESNVSRAMGEAKNLLIRTKEGRAYRYRLSKQGRQMVGKLLEKQPDRRRNR